MFYLFSSIILFTIFFTTPTVTNNRKLQRKRERALAKWKRERIIIEAQERNYQKKNRQIHLLLLSCVYYSGSTKWIESVIETEFEGNSYDPVVAFPFLYISSISMEDSRYDLFADASRGGWPRT